jgi:hypothetical protein
MGLRPGGSEPVAQIVCRQGKRFAWLFDINRAVPKIPMTAAKQAALDKAMQARRRCPKCGVVYGICLPLRTLGSCFPCSDEAGPAA